MKKIFTLFCLSFSMLFVRAQESNTPAADVLSFKETAHDFGKIPQGKPVFYTFDVTNTGKDSLAIANVQTSCGCTTPEWSRDPIAPGATAAIKVGYNAAGAGHFEKYITVLYNGNQTKQIIIKGEVWKAPDGSAPSNASIQLLKQKNQ
ncbi:MAG: DUF1573 domain-containing protein [Terrimonas sp.]|nr:DUF1573 domain-containing protein [Terrimonas sp.]